VSQDAWELVTNERAHAQRDAGGLVDVLIANVQRALSTGRSMGTRFINLEHFVLEHGYHWTIDTDLPLPSGISPGVRGECHANATKLATEHEHLVYVEGYVLHTGLPIRHAWVQLPNGRAVDATFAELHHVKVAEYFGVPFHTDYLLDTSLRAGAFLSLIDDWKAGWPLLSTSAEDLAGVLWAPAAA